MKTFVFQQIAHVQSCLLKEDVFWRYFKDSVEMESVQMELKLSTLVVGDIIWLDLQL